MVKNMPIDDKIFHAIISHAGHVFPEESCGLVVDNGGQLQYIEAANCAPDPTQSFLIDPLFYAAYAVHGLIQFVVHSHPNRSPEPTDADKASSERAAIPFLIVSYPSGESQSYYPQGYRPEYIGRQFVYGIFDCYSLVRDFYQDEFDIQLPDYERPPYNWWKDPANENLLMTQYESNGFRQVSKPQHGDIIVMQLQGCLPNHAAVYLEGGLMIHQTFNTISLQEQYGHYWRKNTICVLRHENN